MELICKEFIKFKDGSTIELTPQQYAEVKELFRAYLVHDKLPISNIGKYDEEP
jgi:hypothetical protein